MSHILHLYTICELRDPICANHLLASLCAKYSLHLHHHYNKRKMLKIHPKRNLPTCLTVSFTIYVLGLHNTFYFLAVTRYCYACRGFVPGEAADRSQSQRVNVLGSVVITSGKGGNNRRRDHFNTNGLFNMESSAKRKTWFSLSLDDIILISG